MLFSLEVGDADRILFTAPSILLQMEFPNLTVPGTSQTSTQRNQLSLLVYRTLLNFSATYEYLRLFYSLTSLLQAELN